MSDFELKDLTQLREERQKLLARINTIDQAIKDHKYLDYNVCKECGGMGWYFKNGWDTQTVKCKHHKIQKG